MGQSYTKGLQRLRPTNTDGSEVNGKWAAYELDGSGFHTCKQQQQQKKEQTKTLTLEQMDIRLKRVEKMLFNGGT